MLFDASTGQVDSTSNAWKHSCTYLQSAIKDCTVLRYLVPFSRTTGASLRYTFLPGTEGLFSENEKNEKKKKNSI